MDDDKGLEPVVINLEGKTAIADFMVVASGTSQRHVAAMADHILEKLKAQGHKGISVEGLSQGDWVLIDAGDVLVHLFRPEVRSFYAIEKMWTGPMEANGTAGH